MSTRTYNLRARAGAGVATQASPAVDIPLPPSPVPFPSKVASRVAGSDPDSGVVITSRTYSDVVASRSPSLRRERPLLPSDESESSVTTDEDLSVARHVDTESQNNMHLNRPIVPQPSAEKGPESGNELPWTTVQRRRARSQSSSKQDDQHLTVEQARSVKLAMDSMTSSQKGALLRRQAKVRPRQDSSASSRGEGPSKLKGKGRDPRDWGDVNISFESLDLEAQMAALNSFKRKRLDHFSERKPSSDRRRDKSSSQNEDQQTSRSNGRARKAKRPRKLAESRPSAQIAPASYLGAALRNVERSQPSTDPSSRSSTTTDSSFSSFSDEEGPAVVREQKSRRSEDMDTPGTRNRDNRPKRNKRRRRSSSSRSASESNIRPIPPKEYNGAADVRAYHRFVRESDAYLQDGKVRRCRKVFLLSYYLSGKAYDFYTQKVAINEEQWTVSQFYNELFDYCFPVDYRMQLRKTLSRCHQNDKSVAEYTHELQDLFNMIGNISEQDQVIKFWNGARPAIQKELWRNKLNPELSSWKKVVSRAEIIEIAENVAERRDKKAGSALQIPGSSTKPSKPVPVEGAARTVTFEPNKHPRSRHRNRQRSAPSQKAQHRTPQSGVSQFRTGQSAHRGGLSSVSSHARPKPKEHRLSDKEKEEYRAAGKCFNCGIVGHFGRNCPENAVVKSSGRGPPGTSAFNLEPMLRAAGTEVEDQVEVLDSLPLGVITMGEDELVSTPVQLPLTDWREHYPYWSNPGILARWTIGDCYGLVAEAVLTLGQPYPGDELLEEDRVHPELRFNVTQKRRTGDYTIHDRLDDSHLVVPRNLLVRPKFDIRRWYATRRSQAFNLEPPVAHRCVMGHALSIVATKLLTDGISSSYPCAKFNLDPADRFRVHPSRVRRNEYSIVDKDLQTTLHVPTSFLEDSTFDLVSWYRLQMNRDDLFNQHHRNIHLMRYCSRSGARVHHVDCPHRILIISDSRMPVVSDTTSCMPTLASGVSQGPEPGWEDLPDLVPASEDEGPDDEMDEDLCATINEDEDEMCTRINTVLTQCQPYPGDGPPIDPSYFHGSRRFFVDLQPRGLYYIYDRVQGFESYLHASVLQWRFFSIGRWYAERCASNSDLSQPWDCAHNWLLTRLWGDTTLGLSIHGADGSAIEVGGIQVNRNKYPALQRNAAHIKEKSRILPKPVVIKVTLNDHPARALLDSGSLGDFISSTLADQLGLTRTVLDTPVSLQLAVQGSRSKVNAVATAQLKYQGINEPRTFDIINLSNYDLILGTPWMHQHQLCVGFNPARVVIGSDEPLPLKVGTDTKLMVYSLTPEEQSIEDAREELRRYAEPLCKEVSETDLPPFRAINHTIPLIDTAKVYPWRPSRCPDAFRDQWAEKRNAYINSGRWKVTSAGNTVPMLLIPKPGTNPPELRTVVDLRERNKNTHKLTSPLPDMDGMLRRTASKPFRTALDLKSAYEQIRIVPEHVDRSTVTTPDGNMVSQVIQIGDCNAPATYQALMNHLFSSSIGRFMDIYLDDIVIYSDTLKNHVEHVKSVLDILIREKLYLSRSKLRFIAMELKILGRIIDNDGIRMDTEKVNSVLKWKVPTNRDLLRGFIGSVGYLADDIPNVRIPMGVLSSITGDTVPFRWGFTEQRAFDEVKSLVHHAREHRRVPLIYTEGAPTIWMVTDGCATGISGLVSQGNDWKTAKIAAFYSAKLNPAQQNYPVHEIEMLAGIETMLRHADILQGAKFKWLTDHKGLTYLLNQKNLSGRQARWLEKISSFTFEVVYVAGSDNVVADALSRMYSNDSPGTERARCEYTYHDVIDDDTLVKEQGAEELPVLAGIEARVATRRGSRVRQPSQKAVMAGLESSADFAARMRDHFVLKGPQDPARRKEGGSVHLDHQYQNLEEQSDLRSERDIVHTSAQPEISPNMETSPDGASLLDIVSQSMHGVDLLTELCGKYGADPDFRGILAKPNDYRNFEVCDGLVFLKKPEHRVLCIPKVLVQGRSARELVISEAHSMLAHLGASKTLDYLRDHVWWKDMVSDVKAYCETCHTCKISKPSNQKPYGLLNPLSVPSYPWESIGMDFVGPLPESSNRDGSFDSITVVICLLTSMVHLIPSRINYNATQLAELMFEHIYKLHGLPKNIISDRDVLFTSTFWKQLHRLVGTKLRLSSAYHPQSDGSTERANRTITQMLRQCVDPSQKDWVAKLPAIEFAINSARSESTGFAPFFLNFGRMPRNMLWTTASVTEFPSVREFAMQKKLAIMAAHDSILSARIKQTRDANRKRRAAPFQKGELVYLSTQNISFPRGLARKLIPKFIGPYKILQDYGNSSFRLDLPPQLKQRGIHDVFHASLLREHIPNDDRLFPGRMDTQIGNDPETTGEWAVDRIVSHAGSKTDSVFEVKWQSGDITWLPYYQIAHLQALTDYLDLLGKTHIGNLPNGTGQPPLTDPQIFLGGITPTHLSKSVSLAPIGPILKCLKRRLKTTIQTVTSLVASPFRTRHSQPDFTTPNVQLPMPRYTAPRGINHPCFTRVSVTRYLMRDPDQPLETSLHVGQIAEYLSFDAQVRHRGSLAGITFMPIGFSDFCAVWNNGVLLHDPRRVCEVFLAENPVDHIVNISGHPVTLPDFYITPEQTGLALGTAPSQPSAQLQADINHEFIALMVNLQKKQRVAIEERRKKRLRAFETGPNGYEATGSGSLPRANRHRPRRNTNHSSSLFEMASAMTSLSSLTDDSSFTNLETTLPPSDAPTTTMLVPSLTAANDPLTENMEGIALEPAST